MKIGILQTGHVPDEVLRDGLGTYAQMFQAALAGNEFEFDVYDLPEGAFPTGPEAADGWLITGSRHGVYEDHAFIPPLEDLIRQIHAEKRPLVGVCFGHQIIAQALGGKVEKFSGGWNVGRQSYDFGGAPLHLNAWHQDQVVRPPEGAQVLASSATCEVAAMAIGDHVFTVQPHPEFTAPLIKLFIEERSEGIVPDNLREAARDALPASVDSAQVLKMMAQTLKGQRRA